MMKRRERSGPYLRVILAAFLLYVASALPLFAQQITRVAVLDIARIMAVFPQDSAAIKAFETKKAEIQATLDSRSAEIKRIQAKKLEADAQGDVETSHALEQEVARKSAELREWAQARQNELDLMAKALSSGASFLKRLNSRIAQVAESEGYSLVLNAKAQDQGSGLVLWNSTAVDITDKVIQALNSGG